MYQDFKTSKMSESGLIGYVREKGSRRGWMGSEICMGGLQDKGLLI